MSNYSQTTFFGPKDALNSGDPNKVIHGTQVDTELANIATAIASKYDSASIQGITLPFGSGAVGAPSITFQSDTTTGFYRNAAQTIGVTANGALVATIAQTIVTLSSGVSLSVGGTLAAGGASTGLSVTNNAAVGGTLTVSTGGSSIKGNFSVPVPSGNYGITIEPAGTSQIPGINIENSSGSRSLEILYIGSGASTTYGAAANTSVLNAQGALTLSVGDSAALTINSSRLVQVVDDGGTLQVVGWRGTPLNSQSSNYTLTLADRGKCINIGSAGISITVPNGVFNQGDVVTVLMSASGNSTIAQGASFNLVWANGTTASSGSRTITGFAIATILFVSGGGAYISGVGLS